MNELRKRFKHHHKFYSLKIFCFFIVVFGICAPAMVQATVPAMIDYFSTCDFGATDSRGITYIASSGNFAIVDDYNDEVYIVNAAGVLQDNFDTAIFGSSHPSGITYIPADGNFAIVDYSTDEVYIVNASGTLQYSFDTAFFGSLYPSGITYIPADGNFAIVDYNTDEVYIVNAAGIFQDSFDTATFGNLSPSGITYIPADGNFAIVDYSTDEVYIVNTSGIIQDNFDTAFVATTPYGIAYNTNTGNYHVVNDPGSVRNNVFTLDVTGDIVTIFSTYIIGASSPTGITHITGTDNYAIVDSAGDEIFIVDASGTLIDELDISIFSTSPQGITYIPSTNQYAVVDNSADKLFIVSDAGTLVSQFDLAGFGIGSTDPRGVIYLGTENKFAITDPNLDAIFFIDLSKPGKYQKSISTRTLNASSASTGMCMIPENKNFVFVDNSLDKIFITDTDGKLKARVDTTGFLSNRPEGIAYNETTQQFAVLDYDDRQVYILNLPALITPCDKCKGDFNGDNDVDGSDLTKFAAEFGRTDCPN